MPPPSQIEMTWSALPFRKGADAAPRANTGNMTAPTDADRNSRRFIKGVERDGRHGGGALATLGGRGSRRIHCFDHYSGQPYKFAAVDETPNHILESLAPLAVEPGIGRRAKSRALFHLNRDGVGIGDEMIRP